MAKEIKPEVKEEDKYNDILNSDGELDEEKLHQYKKRKIAPLEEIDHTRNTYERVKTVSSCNNHRTFIKNIQMLLYYTTIK
jgi:hypothetical protein